MKLKQFLVCSITFSFSIFQSCCDDDEPDELLAPTVYTNPATNITASSTTVGGEVTNDNGHGVSEYGVYWGALTNAENTGAKLMIETPTSEFSTELSRLSGNATYYVKAYAINEIGEGLGNEVSFTTLGITFNPDQSYGSLRDIDGNVYKTIIIGNQTWMAENLKTTRYNDGIDIPLVTDVSEWGNGDEAFCWYENDSTYTFNSHGGLYNWHTVNTKKLCPSGWHVPSDEEWSILIEYIGGDQIAGGKAKEIGNAHWENPNEGATNESGFTALPGGIRYADGRFVQLGRNAYYWSTSVTLVGVGGEETYFAWFCGIQNSSTYFYRNKSPKEYGHSIRCLKD